MALRSSPAIAAAIGAHAEQLRARFGDRVRFVRLFGSWAQGRAHEGSDVDVAAVVEGLTTDEWREAVAGAAEVELAGHAPLTPFVVSGAHFDALVRGRRRIALDILEGDLAA